MSYVSITSIHLAGCPTGSLLRWSQLTALLSVLTVIFVLKRPKTLFYEPIAPRVVRGSPRLVHSEQPTHLQHHLRSGIFYEPIAPRVVGVLLHYLHKVIGCFVPRSGSSFLFPDPCSSFRILVPRSGSSFLVPDITLDLSHNVIVGCEHKYATKLDLDLRVCI